MSHNTEEWCKIWGGTGLCFEIWHEEFGEFWPNTRNLHFNGLLLTKVYNVWSKTLQRSFVSPYWSLMQYLKKHWLVVWNMTKRIWLIFMHFHLVNFQVVASLKICTLISSFHPKHIKFSIKKYRRVMSHDNEEWFKEKLILEKYAFFVWCNRLQAVNWTYS